MAEHDAPNPDETDSKSKGGLSKPGIVIVGCALVAILYGLLSDDDSISPENAGVGGEFDPELAAEQERQQRERIQQLRDKNASDDMMSNDTVDPYAAMSAMTRRQEMLESKLGEVTAELEKANGAKDEITKLEENYDRLEDQLRELTDLLKNKNQAARNADRDNSIGANNRPQDDLAFDFEGAQGASQSDIADGRAGSIPDFNDTKGEKGATSPERSSVYGENYIVLNASTTGPTERGGGLEVTNPFGSSNKSSDNDDSEGDEEKKATRTLPPEYGADVKPGYTELSQKETTPDTPESEETADLVQVPAFSFVEAETLHGLDCPIGAELPRSSNGNAGGSTPGATQPMPVVLPLRGKIRGPNGNVVNLGTAHLQGWCVGRRVDRGENGRAFIKIEAISYWDRHGKPQYLNSLSGDVISLIDNHRGIQAPVDEVRRSYLGEQATAAALASASTELTQAQFDETRNPEGGVDRVFTGDRAVSYASKGSAAAFETIAKLINEEAQSAFDAVRVSPGSPVKIMFMKPFEVTNHKLEVEDEILDAYDVLI